MKKKIIYALGYFFLFAIIVSLLKYSDLIDGNKKTNDLNYKEFSRDIPTNLNFAGEQFPINDFDSREILDKELQANSFSNSQSILFHKRAKRWFPLIESILKQNKIPDDFKYLALIESGLTNTVSPRGATGYWQFIEPTAKKYGLEISDEIDERYHLEKSTQAACKYFKEAYKTFNSWTLVAASYNMGIGGIQKQINAQKAKTYYDLKLNKETSRYLLKILAVKEAISKPKEYGYTIRKKDLYPIVSTYSIVLDSSIHNLSNFAEKHNSSYKILKIFNPWLKKNVLSNTEKKKYTIQLPKESSANLTWLLEAYSENATDSSNTSINSKTDTVKK